MKNFPRMILYTLIPLFVIGFIAGAFIFAAVKNAVLLFVVATLFGVVAIMLAWNTFWGKRAIFGFLAKHPLSDLATAKDGQLVKVTGVRAFVSRIALLLVCFGICIANILHATLAFVEFRIYAES